MQAANGLDLGDGAFTAYVIALGVSGFILLAIALVGFGGGTGSRIVSGLFGLGFLGYGFYLAFLFTGGEYRILVYVFIVPVLLIINLVKNRRSKQEAVEQAVPPAAPPAVPPAA